MVRADWLPGMIKTDLGTCGLNSSMLVVKSDQERPSRSCRNISLGTGRKKA